MRYLWLHAVAFFVITAGCAHQDAVHQLATLTAARTDDLKVQMVGFVARANTLREDTSVRLGILQDRIRLMQTDTAATLQTWKATGDDKSKAALEVFNAVTVFGNTDALPTAAPGLYLAPSPEISPLKFDPAQYEGLVKQLIAIGQERSILDEAKFLGAYGKAIDDAYKKDVAKASNAMSASSEALGKAASSLPKP